jgi:hypothetical protein
MKKQFLKVATMVALAGVMATACSGSKQMAAAPQQSSSSTDDVDRQIAQKKKAMELAAVEAEAEIQKKKLEMQLKDMDNDAAMREQQTATMLKGNRRIVIPCQQDLLDKPDEYISGFGVSQDNSDIKDANLRSIQAAKADIESRFIGTVKNAMSYYSKDVNVPSGKKMKESELEGGVKDLVHRIVDKEAFRVCGPEIQQQEMGSFDGFAVYRIYLKNLASETAKAVASQAEVLGVDFDKKKWGEAMEAELAADAEKRKAEMAGGR